MQITAIFFLFFKWGCEVFLEMFIMKKEEKREDNFFYILRKENFKIQVKYRKIHGKEFDIFKYI